jgi:pimeloyl-ACP methyl ester carboxylesterase
MIGVPRHSGSCSVRTGYQHVGGRSPGVSAGIATTASTDDGFAANAREAWSVFHGAVALQLLVRYPERLRTVSLIGSGWDGEKAAPQKSTGACIHR